ncbi:MAG: hypothetical protein ABI039_00685, partial [Vicinamibacterales bacterium]
GFGIDVVPGTGPVCGNPLRALDDLTSLPELDAESHTAHVLATVDALRADGTLKVPPTFFEVSTAVAFEIFKRAGVDVAIVEVGLGGRFDATNVLTPIVAAITSIAFDHERHLGSTLSEIAFEKAGIAKPGISLVVGRLPAEAAVRIATVAAVIGAPLFDAHATAPDRHYPPMTLALAGRHQFDNARVATAILERWSALVGEVPTDAIVTGLTQCEWPARLEWLRLPSSLDGELLIDAAHNPAGAAALASYLLDRGARLPIVFAAMADKDVEKMIAVLAPVASAWMATSAPNERSRACDQLAEDIRRIVTVPVEAVASPEAAVSRALELSRRAVAAGSIYMVGPLRAKLIAGGATRLVSST